MTPQDSHAATIDAIMHPTIDILHESQARKTSPRHQEVLLKLLIDAHDRCSLMLREKLAKLPRNIA